MAPPKKDKTVTVEPVNQIQPTPPDQQPQQPQGINIGPQEIAYLYELLMKSNFIGQEAGFIKGLQDKLLLLIQSQQAQ